MQDFGIYDTYYIIILNKHKNVDKIYKVTLFYFLDFIVIKVVLQK